MMEPEQSENSASYSPTVEKKPPTITPPKKTDWEFYLKAGLLVLIGWVVFHFILMIFLPTYLAIFYVGIACMFPIMLTIVSSNQPWYVGTLVYIASSVTVIWLLYEVGDFILPFWVISNSGRHAQDATGSWMAGFAGFALSLFGLIGAWGMVSDAIKEYRKKRNTGPL
jgi:hypothetical protein